MQQPLFFKPNTKFIKWLIKHANGRTIIDAGAGEKFQLSQQLLENGCTKVVAVDPVINYNEYMKWRMLSMSSGSDIRVSFHVIVSEIQKWNDLYCQGQGDKMLLVFARPCHSDFVEEALALKGDDVEALYITVPENLEKYNDLGEFRKRATLLEHEGSSADNEVVYSIK